MLERLKTITSAEFAHLGMGDLAYVRSVTANGVTGFAIFAADGQVLAVFADRAAAYAALNDNELEAVTLH